MKEFTTIENKEIVGLDCLEQKIDSSDPEFLNQVMTVYLPTDSDIQRFIDMCKEEGQEKECTQIHVPGVYYWDTVPNFVTRTYDGHWVPITTLITLSRLELDGFKRRKEALEEN